MDNRSHATKVALIFTLFIVTIISAELTNSAFIALGVGLFILSLTWASYVVYKTRKLRKKLEREISEVEKEIRWYINELAKVKEQRDEGSDVDALLVKLNKELEELQQLKRELLRRRDKSLSLF